MRILLSRLFRLSPHSRFYPFSRLAAALLACALSAGSLLPVLAAPDGAGKAAAEPNPVILLPGYSGPQLFLEHEDGARKQVWNIPINGDTTQTLLEGLINILPKLIVDAGGSEDEVIRRAGEIYGKLFAVLEMNEDGTSRYPIVPYPTRVRDARWDVMLERKEERLNNNRPITNSFLDYVPAEKIYIFSSDWRKGQRENAASLDAFIQQVKADSGCDKVNLFGISYGGQLAAAYFTYYGDKGDVDRAVLHSPATRGSELVYDLLNNEDLTFDLVSMTDFTQVFIQREGSLEWALKGVTLKQINDIAVHVIRTYLEPLALRFGSFWDLMPPEHYEETKRQYLDPARNRRIIEESDAIHYEVMPHIGETLARMQRQGVKIALLCGSGLPLAGGNPVNSDYIINVSSSTGAYAVPLGEALPVDYTCEAPICQNPAHRHLSPAGDVDAACAYLPEHTWFYQGQYHGQGEWDPYARALYCQWLFTDQIQDVHSNPDFPQFRESCNPSDGVSARFSESVSGYLSPEDDTLLIENLSAHDISIASVTASGLDLRVTISTPIRLTSRGIARLRYECILPLKETRFTLLIRYTKETAVPQPAERTLSFTLLPAGAASASLHYPLKLAALPSTFSLWQILLPVLAVAGSASLAAIAVVTLYRRPIRDRTKNKKSSQKRKKSPIPTSDS
ncbi:MAG: hypothetical protein LBJ11_06825 [Oscillospiraceae bacterium]|jgi:pimeloyl-ACP methyl ester carboxylesterase|nr:hypothetical protein [Oscillospiraceae bacterium]